VSVRVIAPLALLGAALWVLAATAAAAIVFLLSAVPAGGVGGAEGGLANTSASASGGSGSASGPAPAAPAGGLPAAPGAVAVGPGYAPSAEALADIPAIYLALYRRAADRFGLDWTILAGIGKVECDHGRDPDPSCTVEGHLNYAGAGGPAQFLVSTWQRYGISATGTGTPDMWNPADAIMSMANYLRAAGAPADYPDAIFAYNHAWWYVAEVMAWATRYRGAHQGRA